MYEKIKDYMLLQLPKEGCGLILDGKFIPCRNDSEKENEFIINKEDYIKASLKGKITAIVHSHNNEDNEKLAFSDHDITASNYLKIPYILVGVPNWDIITHG